MSAVFLDDSDTHPRVRTRLELTRRIMEPTSAGTHIVASHGETTVERVFSLVLLGDLVSLYLAVLRGVDPEPVEAIARLKSELAARGNATPMRSLLTLPVTLPYRIARAGLSLASSVVGQALGHGSGPRLGRAAGVRARRAVPAVPAVPAARALAPAAAAAAPAPVAPLRRGAPPAGRRHAAACPRAGARPPVDEPLPPPPAPPTAARGRAAGADARPGRPRARGAPRGRGDARQPGCGDPRRRAVAGLPASSPRPEIVARLNGADEATKAIVRLFESRPPQAQDGAGRDGRVAARPALTLTRPW
jgi:hypothetical protein